MNRQGGLPVEVGAHELVDVGAAEAQNLHAQPHDRLHQAVCLDNHLLQHHLHTEEQRASG